VLYHIDLIAEIYISRCCGVRQEIR
jgi:hypothetical protein